MTLLAGDPVNLKAPRVYLVGAGPGTAGLLTLRDSLRQLQSEGAMLPRDDVQAACIFVRHIWHIFQASA